MLVVTLMTKTKRISCLQFISSDATAPCGDAEIRLYIVADSSEFQDKREMLINFLRGSRKDKQKLQAEHPCDYSNFEKVWSQGTSHGKGCTISARFLSPTLL